MEGIGNLDLHKGIKQTRTGNYVNKYKYSFYCLNTFKRQPIIQSKKQLQCTMEFITYGNKMYDNTTRIFRGKKWKYIIIDFFYYMWSAVTPHWKVMVSLRCILQTLRQPLKQNGYKTTKMIKSIIKNAQPKSRQKKHKTRNWWNK